jgi:hypothetical protein
MLCWVNIEGHIGIIFHNQSFFVASVLSIMAIEKINVMVSKERYEGLLRYYGKMNVGEFVKQWVTLELYCEILQ